MKKRFPFKAVCGSYIVVDPIPVETTTKSGLILAQAADAPRVKPDKGLVIQVGPGEINNPMTLKDGDKILFRTGAGQDASVEGQEYLILRESDVFTVL